MFLIGIHPISGTCEDSRKECVVEVFPIVMIADGTPEQGIHFLHRCRVRTCGTRKDPAAIRCGKRRHCLCVLHFGGLYLQPAGGAASRCAAGCRHSGMEPDGCQKGLTLRNFCISCPQYKPLRAAYFFSFSNRCAVHT